MNIEILTTKKKLSKSIVKQFENATMPQMNIFLSLHGECAYYITDLGVKYPKRVGIFRNSSGEWVKFNANNWNKSPHTKLRAYSGNRYKDFSTELELYDWVSTKNRMVKAALKNHLII